MFSLFRQRTCEDPELGRLTRYRRLWWAAFELERHDDAVEIGIAGTRTAPNPEGLALARELPGRYPQLIEPIQRALFEHYEPCLEAFETGAFPADVPRIGSAADVWSHVALGNVLIVPMEWGLTIEIGYETAWDVEHRLGARIHAWRLVELCGSA